MKQITDVVRKPAALPERILQFGEGNFLRAFADWMIQKANDDGIYRGSIVICQPVAQGKIDAINRQNGLYTLVMRGMENGKAIERIEQITSISRCINPHKNYDALTVLAHSDDLQVVISNTTEAGISYHVGDKLTDKPPVSYPAKVCAFLYERFRYFGGDIDKGLLFLPTELIDHNGTLLMQIVLRYAEEWQLGDAFAGWVCEYNHFCNTLVDRIVTGYPQEETAYFEKRLGYHDDAIVTSELFHLWVIEGKREWAERFPIHKIDANVIWTDNVEPYRRRKVRILNGAHTACVPVAFLSGYNTVLEMMNDSALSGYLNRLLYQEIVPTLGMPQEEFRRFADSVDERFRNPYIKHRLIDISLNSCSKWCARILPSLLCYVEVNGRLPKLITFSLAAFIKFYQGEMVDGVYLGKRTKGDTYPIQDDTEVVRFFSEVWCSGTTEDVAIKVLRHTEFWNGADLSAIPGLMQTIAAQLSDMDERPIAELIAAL